MRWTAPAAAMTKRPTRKVRRTFDPDALKRICAQQDFSEYGTRYEVGAGRFFHWKDNGSRILATAHLDSVVEDGTCTITDSPAGPVVFSPVLDDRLGAYVILELLPKLGVTVDWLLTTGEETGDSTAADFTIEGKTYDWMFSFDRMGTDVVMYDYDTPELRAAVRDTGAMVGNGSFSDISYLGHLGCAGMNWGVGYQDYHSNRSHAFLDDTFGSVGRFLRFYEANKDTHMAYTPRPRTYYTSYEKFTGKTWSRSEGTAYRDQWEDLLEARDAEQGRRWDKTLRRYVDLPTESVEVVPRLEAALDDDEWPDYCPVCLSLLKLGFCDECGEDWHAAWEATFHDSIEVDVPPPGYQHRLSAGENISQLQEVPA